MSHGFTGNKSELGRFDTAAQEINHAGYNVLKYDYAGCGESEDFKIKLSSHIDDLTAAINFVKELGYQNIGLLGLSTGGLVSLNAYNNAEITAMVLWAPVTSSMDITNGYFVEKQLNELSQKGYLTVNRENSLREITLVDQQMFIDRKNVDQRSLLEGIECPTLIIHGDNDKRIPIQNSEKALVYLNKESKLIIIKDADHLFKKQLNQFITESIFWFKKYLTI